MATDRRITIYRDNAHAVVEVKPKPLYGLLRRPPEHECKPPGWWARLVRLVYSPVWRGDLWRCQCGNVYQLVEGYRAQIGGSPFSAGWTRASTSEWIDAGGDVEGEDEP